MMQDSKRFWGLMILLLFAGIVSAQPYENQYRTSKTPVEFPFFYENTQHISSTEVLTVGAAYDDFNDEWAIMAIKTHPNGTLNWQRVYFTSGEDLKGITFDASSGSAMIVATRNTNDLVAIKINTVNGNLIWSNLLFLGLNTEVAVARKAVVQGQNAHLIGGTTELLAGLKIPFVMAIDDANGNMIYSHHYEETTGNNADLDFTLTDMIVESAVTQCIGNFDGRLAQFDISTQFGFTISNNLLTWGPSSNGTLGGKIDVDELVGNTEDYYFTSIVDANDPTVNSDFYVERRGAGAWAATYSLAGANEHDALAVYRTVDNGSERLFLFGRTKSTTADYDFHMLELNPLNGDIINQFEYDTDGLGGSMTLKQADGTMFWTAYDDTDDNLFYLIHTDPDGTTGCEMTVGFTKGDEDEYQEVLQNCEDVDFGVQQLDNHLQTDLSVILDGSCTANKTAWNANSESTEMIATNIFPNPVGDNVEAIKISLPMESKSVQIVVFDVQGKKVYEAANVSVGSNLQVQLDVDVLANGLNLIQISGPGYLITERVIRN